MAVKSENSRAIGANPNTVVDSDTWIRPDDWLALPTPTTHQMVGLFAVYDNDTQYLAFTATASLGYTVDWGDGVVDNWAGGATASHTYNYSTLSSPVSSRGYKMAIVKVYPQSSSTLVALSLYSVNHPSRVASAHSYNWLDLWINAPNLATLSIGGTNSSFTPKMLEQVRIDAWAKTTFSNQFYFCTALQSVILANSSATVTTCQGMFQSCFALKTAPLFNTATVTSMASMFQSCYALKNVPLYNTANVTSMSGMFSNCFALKTVPLFNTVAVTSMSSMFQECRSLKTVPLFNTVAVTDMSNMFNICVVLESVPLFNTANVTTMSNMFNTCATLEAVPQFNTIKVTNFNGMFNGSSSLQSAPSFNCAALTADSSSMFANCFSLNSIGGLDNSKVTSSSSTASAYTNNTQLSSVNLTLAPFSVTFSGCKLSASQINGIFTNLTTKPSPATVTSASGNGVSHTYNATAHGFRVGQVVSVTGLTPAGYNVTNASITLVSNANSFTTAGATTGTSTGTGTATISNPVITVTGNPGAATCTTSIATTKGWTVTV
ncbi:Bacterial surface protein 26-residue repeat [uncultured Caudovirales phage]|uniref:Bacterial surface protein 26-residue repeat n=1 Tax=uncultured Caudovirales phage TaxID=2100421 RepID=A0A6J5RQE4_9CAUD|nr:Bacterial surface protein 26-residue repeat [uncultured Caudovirales phage]